jgi:16S rRNA (uracil1498-N3)-methyltransferase
LGDKIIVDDKEQVHHTRDVLRLKINAQVVIFDEKGNEYTCILKKVLPRSLTFKIKDRLKRPSAKIRITVACAIPKAHLMDEIVDKLTQLGIDTIIPLETERVIVKLDEQKKLVRQERWRKIALSASLQSRRISTPIIEPIKNIQEALKGGDDFDLKLIPTLIGERKSLKELLMKLKPQNILVLIGPEGDFTEEELDLAKSKGCIPVSLGDLVLRVETAALAVVSFIRLYANS